MATMRGRLATSVRGDEKISREAWKSLAEQARGMPVTLNFDPTRIVGRVTEAQADGVGVYVEVEPTDDYARSFQVPYERFAPGGVRRPDGSFDLKEVAALGPGGTPIEDPRPEDPPDQALKLGPGERLLLRYSQQLPPEALHQIAEESKRALGAEGRILIVCGAYSAEALPPVPERAALEDLLALILDDLPAAHRRDVETVRPTAAEEAKVRARIEELAARFRSDLFGGDDG